MPARYIIGSISNLLQNPSTPAFFQLQLWSVDPEDSALSSPEPIQIEAANRAPGYDQEDGVCD